MNTNRHWTLPLSNAVAAARATICTRYGLLALLRLGEFARAHVLNLYQNIRYPTGQPEQCRLTPGREMPQSPQRAPFLDLAINCAL